MIMASTLRLETIPSQTLPTVSKAHLGVNTFSPVTKGGSFEFDRVIKRGNVEKRTRRRNIWKATRLVLRPSQLSIYKDEDETKLRHQLNMADVEAVALRKDVKRKGEHEGVFGVFMSDRNFFFESPTREEAMSWVDAIRKEARVNEQHEELTVTSASGVQKIFAGYGRTARSLEQASRTSRDSSSPDGNTRSRAGSSAIQSSRPIPIRKHSQAYDYSGSDPGTHSESETPAFGSAREFSPIAQRLTRDSRTKSVTAQSPGTAAHPYDTHNANESRASFLEATKDENRVVWQGYLQCLKTRGGVRNWKRCWIVLRAKSLGLYKNEEEYSPLLIIPIDTIVDAVDTDPLAKGKQFCMQIITDEKSYRFCAADEDELSKWLGSLKSVLSRRRR